MPLSKLTTDQIRKEAEEQFPACLDFDNEHRYAYIAGATAWAVWKEKAEWYEKALKEINELCVKAPGYVDSIVNDIQQIVTKTLEQFK